MLRPAPISLRAANAYVKKNHRHHKQTQGHKFSIAAMLNDEIVGVVIIGRPVARHRDDGLTAEVTRLCTDGTKNVCSLLLSRAARAAAAMGYHKIGTYTLPEEGGASLRAAGWTLIGERGGGEWSVPSRSRRPATHPTGVKLLWERDLYPVCREGKGRD